MFKIKAVFITAMLSLLAGAAVAETSPTKTIPSQSAAQACPAGKYDANHPGVPKQCVECAAPGCPSCHNERTKATVADTDNAERNCPPAVKPH